MYLQETLTAAIEGDSARMSLEISSEIFLGGPAGIRSDIFRQFQQPSLEITARVSGVPLGVLQISYQQFIQ